MGEKVVLEGGGRAAPEAPAGAAGAWLCWWEA